MRLYLVIVSVCLLTLPAAADARNFTAQDLVTMERLSDPQPSPDGEWIAFVRRTTDVEADKGRTDVWLVGADGSGLRQLTTDPMPDSSPRWSPDGKYIYYLSGRSGSSQIWRLEVESGDSKQISDLQLPVANLVVNPPGDLLAFTLEVFPDCEDVACTKARLDEREKGKVTGQVYDSMFVRHWDTVEDGRRSHLFVMPVNGNGIRHLTPGLDADVPSVPFGGAEEIAFTPDRRGIVFTARDVGAAEAWSTDFDLYYVPVTGATAPRLLTEANEAWDTQPVFSPDGRTLAYLAMERPGFESDRFRIVLQEWPGGERRVLTEEWDRSPGSFFFSPDGKTIYATAADVGEVGLFAIDVATGSAEKLIGDGHVRSVGLAGERFVYGLDHLKSPVELYSAALDGSDARRITDVNAERLAEIEFGDYEQFSFPGWSGETVYGYLIKPANFDPDERYPLAFLIHGGPQGSFDNDFHYRWNPQIYAGAGYAAVMIDFHGSTGYGQEFTDSISGDWGGKPLEDLQKGLAWVLDRYPWIDGDRACALGASYGGYMINWIAGNWPDGFRCLVNHDGVFDNRMMYFATEELWFPEWEHGGPYWESPEGHEKHNPALHVDRWKTPMLVIHGALDFRVPETQGLAAFTALQRQGVPSRFLYFPNENHWVLRPANSVFWHETVLEWLDRWTLEVGE
jgi:dipeptidyl aminopeptidase/acylaminoacyl peptidase